VVSENTNKGTASARSPLTPGIASGLIDAREVACHLGVAVSTVHRLASRGELPRVVLGPRLVRFRRTDVEAFIAARMSMEEPALSRTERLLGGGGRRASRPSPRTPRNDLAIARHQSVHGKQESPRGAR
jgi:excisionase family DNA binding protein